MTEETNPDSPLATMLRAYQNIRTKRSEIKREFEEADGKLRRNLELIEVALLKVMNESGTDQLKVAGVGLAYRSDKVRVSAKDWDALWQFISDNDRLDFLQRRLSSKIVQEYIDENDGELPPGVDVSKERAVVVKRA